jgi:hypothetical protein
MAKTGPQKKTVITKKTGSVSRTSFAKYGVRAGDIHPRDLAEAEAQGEKAVDALMRRHLANKHNDKAFKEKAEKAKAAKAK